MLQGKGPEQAAVAPVGFQDNTKENSAPKNTSIISMLFLQLREIILTKAKCSHRVHTYTRVFAEQ